MGPKGEWDRQTADFFIPVVLFLKEVVALKIPKLVRANITLQTIRGEIVNENKVV
jgi:hypothetical protein